MTQEFTNSDEQYICDECGYTSPVANERCPDCGSVMSALHDEKPRAKIMSGENDEDLSEEAMDGSSSLQALAEEEQEESDKEYQNDTFGNE